MKFTYANNEYEIHFKYPVSVDVEILSLKNYGTECELLLNEKDVIAHGSSWRDPNDQQCKEYGRQWAMWRMVDHIIDRALRGATIAAFFGAATNPSKKETRRRISMEIRASMAKSSKKTA